MSQLFYLISESFSGWKEHRMVVFPALVTIFLCSVLLCVALFTLRASNRILQTEGSFYTIDVFLKDSVPQEEIKLIEKKLKTEKWLDSLSFISKEDALKIFQRNFSAEMLEMVDENPLPASFKLTMKKRYWSPGILEEWIGILERDEHFEAVQAPLTWAKLLADWKGKIYFFPILGIFLLLFTLVLIIGNAIRLSLYSRKNLVENMKYTGASRFFIEFPFVLEGLSLGFLGSLVAAFLSIISLETISRHFPIVHGIFEGYLLPVGITIVSVSFLSALVSLFSVRRFLLKDKGANN